MPCFTETDEKLLCSTSLTIFSKSRHSSNVVFDHLTTSRFSVIYVTAPESRILIDLDIGPDTICVFEYPEAKGS